MSARRKGRLLLAGIIAVVVATTTALLVTAGPATARGTASLAILEGSVTVEDAEGTHDGADGETLDEGDVVRTGVDGRAEIRFFDGSVTRLDRETQFEVTQLEVLEEGGGKQVVATQTGGRTFSRVVKLTDSESRFEVATPTATASVRGTIFDTRNLPDGGSVVWVLEGAVAVTGTDERLVMVHAFEGVRVDGDGTTNAVFALQPWQLRDPWVQFNLCELDLHVTCEPDRAPIVPPPPASDQPGGDQVLGSVVTNDAEVSDDGARSTSGGDEDSKKDKPKEPPSGGGGGGGGGGEDPDPPEDPDPTLPELVVGTVCNLVGDVTGSSPPEPPCS